MLPSTMPAVKGAGGNPMSAVGVVGMTLDGIPLGASVDEIALRSGRAFVGATQVQTVDATNQLFITFQNPANSGVNCFITLREFAANTDTNDSALEYQAYINPTAVLTQTGVTPNRKAGAPAPMAQLKWQIAPSITMGGSSGTGGFIPVGGATRHIPPTIIIPPGVGYGLSVFGSGGGVLTNQARICYITEWFEEPL